MILDIHMKSGKTISQRSVKDFTLKYRNDDITELHIELFFWAKRKIIMSSLSLSQIECMTRRGWL